MMADDGLKLLQLSYLPYRLGMVPIFAEGFPPNKEVETWRRGRKRRFTCRCTIGRAVRARPGCLRLSFTFRRFLESKQFRKVVHRLDIS